MNATFHALLLNLAAFFAADPAAVSVNTDNFGTIHRDQVPNLLRLTAARAARDGQ